MSYSKTKPATATRNNAVIYARYSSSSQQDQSIDGQIRVITEFAQRQGYRIIDSYIDRAMTGRNDDRPDFQRMITASFHGGFDYVIVYKLDRFSRSRYDSAVHKRTLRNNGVKVISATESISDTPEGIMFESILEGYNEFFSAELSQKVKRGIKESWIKGNFTGGHILYGYDAVNKKLIVNEREAENVRKIFTDCARGVLLKNIAAELNEQGYRSKTRTLWTTYHISRILNNEKYCGIVRSGDEVYKNIVPPIVDEELYKKVGSNMKKNNRRTAHFNSNIPFYLSGKLFCMNCGVPMNGESGTGTHNVFYYYKCSSNKRKKGSCPKRTVRRDTLEDYIIEKIEQYILQRKYIMTVAAEMSANFNAKIKSDDSLNLLKREQAQNDKELQNTLSAVRMGLATQSMKEMLEQLEERKNQIAIEIAKLSGKQPKTVDVNECADFLFSLTALDFSVAENRKLLFDRFVKRVELGNRKIRIFFNPIDKPYLYSEKEDDLEPMEKEDDKGKSPADSDIIGRSSGDAVGDPSAARTRDTVIKSHVLYRLS